MCVTVAEQVSFYTRREGPFVTVAINLTFPLVSVASHFSVARLLIARSTQVSFATFLLIFNAHHIKTCDQHGNGANNTLYQD
jgi:hypothetical protein